MTEGPIIQTMADLAAALNQERMRQGVKLLELDHLAKLQSGYSAKIVSGMKRLGELSLPGILRALNLRIQLAPCKLSVTDPETGACVVIHREERKRIASAGGKARAIKLDASRRREIARIAGLERQRRAKLMKLAGIEVQKKKRIGVKSGEKPQGELF